MKKKVKSRAFWRIISSTFLFSLCVPLLTGCWDMREVEHLFYVNTLGIDYQSGKYIVYLQILNPEAIAKKTSGGGTSRPGAWVAKGDGRTVLGAMHAIYATTQRRIFWGHTTSIVITEQALLHGGIQEAMDIPTRYFEFRYLPWMYCTNAPLPALLNVQPIIEGSPIFSILSDPIDMYGQSSYVVPKQMFGTIRDMLEPGRPSLLPELSIKKSNWMDAKKSYPEPTISGVGVLRHGYLIGRLGREQLVGFRWIMPETRRTIVILHHKEQPVAILTLHSPIPMIKPTLTGKQLVFDVKLRVSGYISEQMEPISEQQIKKLATQQIEHEIRETYAQGIRLKTDIYGLSQSFYRQDTKSYWQWVHAGKTPLLRNYSLRHVAISISLDNSGRTLEAENHYNR